MARSFDELKLEFSPLREDWRIIYQWPQTSACRYTEWIAEWLVECFPNIRLDTVDLRENLSFRVRLNTGIKQFTEKRFLRAMFNRRRARDMVVVF